MLKYSKKINIQKSVPKPVFPAIIIVMILVIAAVIFVGCYQNIWRQPFKNLKAEDLESIKNDIKYTAGGEELYWPLSEDDVESFVELLKNVKIKGISCCI